MDGSSSRVVTDSNACALKGPTRRKHGTHMHLPTWQGVACAAGGIHEEADEDRQICMNLLLRGILSRLLHLQRLAGWTAGDVCYDQQTPRNPKLMKNVLAFFVTVFIGVAAGSCPVRDGRHRSRDETTIGVRIHATLERPFRNSDDASRGLGVAFLPPNGPRSPRPWRRRVAVRSSAL
jgi:hypothetical protein